MKVKTVLVSYFTIELYATKIYNEESCEKIIMLLKGNLNNVVTLQPRLHQVCLQRDAGQRTHVTVYVSVDGMSSATRHHLIVAQVLHASVKMEITVKIQRMNMLMLMMLSQV